MLNQSNPHNKVDMTAEKCFSYEKEHCYYSRKWPEEAKPYLHLERYLRCWLDPDVAFAGKRILDVGAGECTYTRLIADRFAPREVIACELFRERMLPAFRENRNPRLKAVTGNCFHLPFSNCSFDVVFASLIFSQIPNLNDALWEIARVLQPGGMYIGLEPNFFNPINLYRNLSASPNQYRLWPHKIGPMFESAGLKASLRFFNAKLPWARSWFSGTCVGIVAHLPNSLTID
jgi:ubiquinone/menaquinone biosynthesis C-methylase UbiE